MASIKYKYKIEKIILAPNNSLTSFPFSPLPPPNVQGGDWWKMGREREKKRELRKGQDVESSTNCVPEEKLSKTKLFFSAHIFVELSGSCLETIPDQRLNFSFISSFSL